MKRYLLIILSLAMSLGAMAQNEEERIPFNGLISQQSGAKLSKIKVEVKSTGKYTYTDKLGRFGLTNVKPDDILILTGKNLSVETDFLSEKPSITADITIYVTVGGALKALLVSATRTFKKVADKQTAQTKNDKK